MNKFFQHFLWNVAGAERSILEKCPTDHKKFAAVGATILMTAVIAFFAGTSAAWYFTQSGSESSGNIWGSCAFGLLWATLIFTIDRSLVITLKKNPELKRQKWLVPFFSRAALAVLIAFMVSIPLELLIFEGLINEQTIPWKNMNDTDTEVSTISYRYSQQITSDQNTNIEQLSKKEGENEGYLSSYENNKRELEKLRKELDKPTTTRYTQAQDDYKKADTKIKQLQGQKEDAENNHNFSLAQSYQKEINDTYSPQRKKAYQVIKEEKDNWNAPRKARIKKLEDDQKSLNESISANKELIKQYEQSNLELLTRKNRYDQQTDSLVAAHSLARETSNHFIQNFRVLEWSVSQPGHKTDLFFLWIIRLLFFIIEILPTVVKIVTPIGSYDWMVHREEQNLRDYLMSSEYSESIKHMHEYELKAKEDALQQQHEAEQELKKQILENMSNAQLRVANAAIANWESEQMSKFKSIQGPQSEKETIVSPDVNPT